MENLIQDIIQLVEDNNGETSWIFDMDLRRLLKNSFEDMVKEEVDNAIKEVQEESWNDGYTRGKRDAFDNIKEAFETALDNVY